MIGAYFVGVFVIIGDMVYFDVSQELYVYLGIFTATFTANYNRRRHTDVTAGFIGVHPQQGPPVNY